MSPYELSLNRRLRENGIMVKTTVVPQGWKLVDDGRDEFVTRVVNGAEYEMHDFNRRHMHVLPKGQVLVSDIGWFIGDIPSTPPSRDQQEAE